MWSGACGLAAAARSIGLPAGVRVPQTCPEGLYRHPHEHWWSFVRDLLAVDLQGEDVLPVRVIVRHAGSKPPSVSDVERLIGWKGLGPHLRL